MTFPSYRHLLDLRAQPRHPELGESRRVQPFGVVARRAGEPAALALAEFPVEPEDSQPPHLLSVFVKPEERRRGLGSALVGAVEDETRRRGFDSLSAVYTTGKPAIEWMERILTRRGWDPPEAGSLTVRFRPSDALASPAFSERRIRAYSRGLEIFPWSQVTAEDIDEMQRTDEERCWIEPSLEPWQYFGAAVDASSVAARYRGRVVGWVINHRVVAGLVRFSISYMRRDISRRGRILPLYHASLKQVVEDGGARYCTFITPMSYPNMVSFVERWIAPFATFIGESRTRNRSGLSDLDR